MTDAKQKLDQVRAALEKADGAIVTALNARAAAMNELRALRDADPGGYFPLPRDEDILARAQELCKDFPAKLVGPVVRELLSASHAMIEPRRVAYVGPVHGFGHLAARAHFGAAAVFRATDTVADVLESVARGREAFGVVPFETSTEGALTATLHGLERSDAKICAEHTIVASYHLFSTTGSAAAVEKIYGAPAAIAACERHLRNHFPKANVNDVPSFEVAAERAESDPAAAAVGTSLVTEVHDLKVIEERIEDALSMEVRFAIVGSDLPSRSGQDRTVLAMAVHDNPGSLYEALKPFAARKINLTRLESRPSHDTPWRYLFFVEMDGHITDRPILTAIEELRGISRHVKILGSYPLPL